MFRQPPRRPKPISAFLRAGEEGGGPLCQFAPGSLLGSRVYVARPPVKLSEPVANKVCQCPSVKEFLAQLTLLDRDWCVWEVLGRHESIAQKVPELMAQILPYRVLEAAPLTLDFLYAFAASILFWLNLYHRNIAVLVVHHDSDNVLCLLYSLLALLEPPEPDFSYAAWCKQLTAKINYKLINLDILLPTRSPVASSTTVALDPFIRLPQHWRNTAAQHLRYVHALANRRTETCLPCWRLKCVSVESFIGPAEGILLEVYQLHNLPVFEGKKLEKALGKKGKRLDYPQLPPDGPPSPHSEGCEFSLCSGESGATWDAVWQNYLAIYRKELRRCQKGLPKKSGKGEAVNITPAAASHAPVFEVSGHLATEQTSSESTRFSSITVLPVATSLDSCCLENRDTGYGGSKTWNFSAEPLTVCGDVLVVVRQLQPVRNDALQCWAAGRPVDTSYGSAHAEKSYFVFGCHYLHTAFASDCVELTAKDFDFYAPSDYVTTYINGITTDHFRVRLILQPVKRDDETTATTAETHREMASSELFHRRSSEAAAVPKLNLKNLTPGSSGNETKREKGYLDKALQTSRKFFGTSRRGSMPTTVSHIGATPNLLSASALSVIDLHHWSESCYWRSKNDCLPVTASVDINEFLMRHCVVLKKEDIVETTSECSSLEFQVALKCSAGNFIGASNLIEKWFGESGVTKATSHASRKKSVLNRFKTAARLNFKPADVMSPLSHRRSESLGGGGGGLCRLGEDTDDDEGRNHFVQPADTLIDSQLGLSPRGVSRGGNAEGHLIQHRSPPARLQTNGSNFLLAAYTNSTPNFQTPLERDYSAMYSSVQPPQPDAEPAPVQSARRLSPIRYYEVEYPNAQCFRLDSEDEDGPEPVSPVEVPSPGELPSTVRRMSAPKVDEPARARRKSSPVVRKIPPEVQLNRGSLPAPSSKPRFTTTGLCTLAHIEAPIEEKPATGTASTPKTAGGRRPEQEISTEACSEPGSSSGSHRPRPALPADLKAALLAGNALKPKKTEVERRLTPPPTAPPVDENRSSVPPLSAASVSSVEGAPAPPATARPAMKKNPPPARKTVPAGQPMSKKPPVGGLAAMLARRQEEAAQPVALVPAKKAPLGRKLFWKPLEGTDLADTVFGQLLEDKNAARNDPEFTSTAQAEIMNKIFSKKAAARKVTSVRHDVPAVSEAQQKEVVKIIDDRRAQNVGIVILRMKKSTAELASQLLRMDCNLGSDLTVEMLQKLEMLFFTADEEQQLEEYLRRHPEATTLREVPEQRLLPLRSSLLPRGPARARILEQHLKLPFWVTDLNESLDILTKACNEMRSSSCIRAMLRAVLKWGNYVNYGTSELHIKAITLGSLLKLTEFKTAVDAKVTSLHYIVATLLASADKVEEAIALSQMTKEMPSVKNASRITTEALESSWRQITAAVIFVNDELRLHKAQYAPTPDGHDRGLQTLEDIAAKMQASQDELDGRIKGTMALVQGTAKFFGDDEIGAGEAKTFFVGSVFLTLSTFLSKFEECVTDVVRRTALYAGILGDDLTPSLVTFVCTYTGKPLPQSTLMAIEARKELNRVDKERTKSSQTESGVAS